MNLAFAIEHFSPEQGGAERYAWGLAQWLAARGHSIDVYTRRAPAQIEFIRELHLLDARDAAAFARALENELAQRRYDIVQGFNHVWPCDILRLGGGVHLAFEKYNALSSGRAAARVVKSLSYSLLPRYRALRANERRQLADPKRHFIAVSQRVADDMIRFYPAVRDRIHVIYNGVDTLMFNPEMVRQRRSAARARWKLGTDSPTLLLASNNFRLKGLRDLIAALPEIKIAAGHELRVLVAGRGHPAAYLRQARKAGVEDALIFCGSLDELRDAYAAADALVHPSYYDAFGFVGLEAMACGLPVVVSRNSGVSELATDGKGAVLVDMPCSTSTLAAAIIRAMLPQFRKEAAGFNTSIAQQFTLENNYRKVLALYESVAGTRR